MADGTRGHGNGLLYGMSARSWLSWPAVAFISTRTARRSPWWRRPRRPLRPRRRHSPRRRLLLRNRPRRQDPRPATSPRRARRSPTPGGWRPGATSPAPKWHCRAPTAPFRALPRRRPRGARSPTWRTTRGDGRRDRADRRQDAARIATLVEAARAAIARRDYDAADRALDEAERIDARDPAVVRARNELLERPHARAGGRPELTFCRFTEKPTRCISGGPVDVLGGGKNAKRGRWT